MENIIISFNVVAPTFLVLVLGYALTQKRVVSKDFLQQANKLVFNLFFPCLLFNNIYKTDLKKVFNGMLFIYTVGGLVLLFLILCLVVPLVIKEHKKRGVVIQGIFRGNYLIFGVAMVTNMYGEEKAAVASMLSAAVIPIYNLLSVIALEVFTGQSKTSLKHTLKSIATNPLILATLSAVAVSLLGIRFPAFIETTLGDLAKVATPMALFVLGGDFDFRNAMGNLRLALSAVLIKLVVLPLIVLPPAIMLGFRGPELLSVALSFATPVAVSSYIMAQQAKADHQLAGQLVVISSCLCLITIFIMIFVLKQIGVL